MLLIKIYKLQSQPADLLTEWTIKTNIIDLRLLLSSPTNRPAECNILVLFLVADRSEGPKLAEVDTEKILGPDLVVREVVSVRSSRLFPGTI
jgi:hypothetical protein